MSQGASNAQRGILSYNCMLAIACIRIHIENQSQIWISQGYDVAETDGIFSVWCLFQACMQGAA